MIEIDWNSFLLGMLFGGVIGLLIKALLEDIGNRLETGHTREHDDEHGREYPE